MSPTIRTKLIYIVTTISGLLLILYLPVLIWSPPWGNKGYYLHKDYTNPMDWSEEHSTFFFFNDGKLVYKMIMDGEFSQSADMHFKNIGNNRWSHYEKIKRTTYRGTKDVINHYMIQIEGNKFDYTTFYTDQHTPKYDLVKITNPFTIWYIKWLEWTN